MQTFLSYANFIKSARSLDNKRLGKQRVGVLQLLTTLKNKKEGIKSAWQNHPAAKMWEGSEYWLINYGLAICDIWIDEGFKDTCRDKIKAFIPFFEETRNNYPCWIGDGDFHRSHQSNLIRKDPDFYGPQFGSVPYDLPYIWPENKKVTK